MNNSDDVALRRVQVGTTAVATATVVAVLMIGAVTLVRSFEHQQLAQIDRRMMGDSGGLASMPETITPTVEAWASGLLLQFVDEDGRVLFAADRLQDEPAMREVSSDPASPVTANIAGVGRVRVAAIPYARRWVLVAEPLAGVDDAVATLTTALVIGLPILTAILGALLWVVIGRTLRPVREAMARERQLIADVSHELRTPLAGGRALLESESQVPAEIELNRLEALQVLTRLETIANDLLVSERNDEGHGGRDEELIDLDDVVITALKHVPRRAGVELDTVGLSAGQLRGSEHDLERMATNLLTNAVRHARSRVRITLAEDAGTVVLTIADDGPGIDPPDRERIFERFTRLDDSRARDDAGAGLGLPIARSVVTTHGGSIDVTSSPLGGAAFTVTLPRAASTTRTGVRADRAGRRPVVSRLTGPRPRRRNREARLPPSSTGAQVEQGNRYGTTR